MVERDTRLQKPIVDVKPKEASPFPEDPNDRFEAVFAALGNSEAKCLTLLCLSQSPMTETDLHRSFVNQSGEAWKSNSRIQANYCKDKLIPIGLVDEADTLYFGAMEYTVGFRLTEAGRRFGQPIAAFLLEQSSKLPYSLLEIFGMSGRGRGIKARGVLNSASILEFIAQQNTPQRRKDISLSLRLNRAGVTAHLEKLSRLGLVEYSSVNKKGQFNYTLSPDADRKNVSMHAHYRNLSQDVLDLLFELKTVEYNQLADILKEKYPTYLPSSLANDISTILSHFTKQKICTKGVFQARQVHSQATITEAGRRIVSEVIQPIRQALAGDHNLLNKWRRITWQNYAREAIVKYRLASGNANPKPLEEWTNECLYLIKQNPGIRPKEITSMLGRSSYDPLKNLLHSGKVRRERKGNATLYYSS